MDFSFLNNYYGFFINGTKITIFLAFFTVILGLVLGTFLSLMKLSKNKLISLIATSYIEFIRGTPLLVQLYLIYYGFPSMGIEFPSISGVSGSSEFIAGVIALSINSAAYIAEIIRAGIQAVDKGQDEAGRSLGFDYKDTMRYIIIPQAFKNVLPALGNEFIVVVKESAIVSIIGIHDLMYNTDTVRGNTFKAFEPLIVTAVIYFMITFTLSKFVSNFERRLATND